MLKAEIKIDSLDYEKTLITFFPMIMSKLERMEKQNFAVRLLLHMGEETKTVVIGVLNHLDETSKHQVICGAVNQYAQEITQKLNKALGKNELGQNIRLDGLSAVECDNELMLCVRNMEVDYNGLLKNQAVQNKINEAAGKKVSWLGEFAKSIAEKNAGKFARAAAMIAPEMTEETALKYLHNNDVKAMLIEVMEQVLCDKGISVKIKDIKISSTDQKGQVIDMTDIPFKEVFSKEWEDKIIEATVAYLKELMQ